MNGYSYRNRWTWMSATPDQTGMNNENLDAAGTVRSVLKYSAKGLEQTPMSLGASTSPDTIKTEEPALGPIMAG